MQHTGGLTALHDACYAGYADIVKRLVDSKANVDARCDNGNVRRCVDHISYQYRCCQVYALSLVYLDLRVMAN